MRRFLLIPLCLLPLAIGSVHAHDARLPLRGELPTTEHHVAASFHPASDARDAGGCDHQPQPHRYAGEAGTKPLRWLTYRQPLLPPPSSFYGYFNSPPQHAHLWDSYCPGHCSPIAQRASKVRK